MKMEPTAFGDEVAGRVRQWYEANREGFWDRHRLWGSDPDRAGTHADEFMLRLISEVDKAREFIKIGFGR